MSSSEEQIAGHDAPVSRQEEDLLNRWSVARAVDRAIDHAPQGWSTRIGLYGRWGGGKTSVLRFLRTLTEERGDIVVEFSAWLASGEGGVIHLFYAKLLEVLKARGLDVEPRRSWIKRQLGSGSRITQEIGGAGARAAGSADGDIAQAVTVISVAMQASSEMLGGLLRLMPADVAKLQRALGRRRVIVFIDDLDRTDPRLIPKTLLALRELLDWPNFAFVLAFDKRVIASALGEYSKAFGESADEFLEKVVDISFELPDPTQEQVAALALDTMASLCEFIPVEARERAARYFPSNPRHAKQVVRSLATLKEVAARHDHDELNWLGILLQTILRHAASDVAAAFEASSFGMDPGQYALDEDRATARENAVTAALAHDTVTGLSRQAILTRGIWLRALLAEIQPVRGRDPQEKCEYEMRLVTDEPAFTHREVRTIAARHREQPGRVNLSIEINAAVRQSNASRDASALDLLLMTASHIGLGNEALGSTLAATRAVAARAAVEEPLTFAEFLWDSQDPDIVRARRGLDVVSRMLGLTNAFATRAEGAAAEALLDRQTVLALKAAGECSKPCEMYFATNPEGHAPSNMRVAALLERVRQVSEPEVVKRIHAMFVQRLGLEKALRNDAAAGRTGVSFFLQWIDSPLYRGEPRAELLRLLDVSTSSKEHAENVTENAQRYLATIGMLSTSDSWTGDSSAFAEAHGPILQTAWQLLLNQDEEFRSAVFLTRLRNSLVQHGFPESLFDVPAWMIAATPMAAVVTAAVPPTA